MEKLWEGRFEKKLSEDVTDFNSSLSIDSRMFAEDITGSIVHVTMLGKTGIISEEESKKIAKCLTEILDDIKNGKLKICNAEDIHSFVENELTSRIGDSGKKLHTARSRNDQVALDVKMLLRVKIDELIGLLMEMIEQINSLSEKNLDSIMPGYTHLQRAQPITFAHHLMAYNAMFMRDISRLLDNFKRLNVNPLGCCALAGTTYPIDRKMTTDMLGFDSATFNSIDGVSDRDYVIETIFDISLIMTHLSRFCEEIILWSSWEFGFITLDDAFSTGSSIMPNKKNPDIAELVRGKTGRVYGDLIGLLTVLKGLPLAYNKDMQEDKSLLFDCVDTVFDCIKAFKPMLKTITINKDKMKQAAAKGFINATDCADYLVCKGLAFRDAYKISGEIVGYCIKNDLTLETMSIEEYKKFNKLFDQDVFAAIDLVTCVEKRVSEGGPSKKCVQKQIEICKKFIKDIKC